MPASETNTMIGSTLVKFLLFSSCFFGKIGDFGDATSIKMDYLPIGHARVDPILRDDCVSDHVHTFYGPQSGVDPRRINSSDKLEIHAKLLATDVSENTGNVEENKSMYWHPTVYKHDQSTNTHTRDVMAQSSAYYVWETGETRAFPNGFRMIGGFDINQSRANAECVNESPCDEGDCYTENQFFPANKCDELEVSMSMPNCWDGASLDSPPDHTSHVAYTASGEFDGECPDSHPIKLPQIQLFFRIMPYNGGWHTFSDGSGVFHADYVSGWDEQFLQDLLDGCDNEGAGAMPNFFCEDVLTYRDAPKCTDEETCDFSDPNLLEKVRAFQPSPALDIQGTIVAEETAVIVGNLPRGTCNGSLVGSISNPTSIPTANPIGNPTPSPTSIPTASPISSPTPSPTSSPNDCQDDPSFRFKNNPNRTCQWVKRKVDRLCRNASVSVSCPKACNKCSAGDDDCQDDASFRHKGKNARDCDWIGRKSLQICKKKNSNFIEVQNSCPVACGACSFQ